MSHHSLSQIIADDLLSILLDEEENAYPWDLADPTTEATFREREGDFSRLDVREEGEMVDRSETFFAALQQRWDEIEETIARPSSFEKFAPSLPPEYLNDLVKNALSLVDRPIEALDRLVACIGPLFPRWSVEDLQVFARPYALAMRDESPTADPRDWRTLSEMEKIRRSASIAGEILRELDRNP